MYVRQVTTLVLILVALEYMKDTFEDQQRAVGNILKPEFPHLELTTSNDCTILYGGTPVQKIVRSAAVRCNGRVDIQENIQATIFVTSIRGGDIFQDAMLDCR